ncbi:MAG: ABC transporter substrate-binding protein [Candidatus Yonathbacteria bacterium]|nr:ABC transporter substrate-binding protein [Candidatus Yonathbacteria bacterium]
MSIFQKSAVIIALIFTAVAGYWYWSSGTGVRINRKFSQSIVIVDPGGASFAELFRGFQETLKATHPDSALLSIIYMNAEGNQEKLKQFVSEAVSMNPSLIATVSSPPTLQALGETKESKIPILAVLGDPTKHGYITSLQSSGMNLSGIAQQSIELTPKRFEILKELATKVKRVAVFYDTTCGPTKEARPIANAAAPKLGLALVEFPLTTPSRDDLKKALSVVNTKDFDAIMFYPHGTLFSKSDLFLAKAKELKLPIVMPEEGALKDGAVASYGPNYYFIGKQLARQAEKVLNGVDPKDIPFEQAENIQLVIDLKNAKFLDIKIPTTVLERADKVVDGQ